MNIAVSPALRLGVATYLDSDLLLGSHLDDGRRAIVEPSLSLAAWYAPQSAYRLFLNLEPGGVFDLDSEGEDERLGGIDLVEAFVVAGTTLFDRPLYLKVGRQRFEDPREWLYDEELDAIRVTYLVSGFALELSGSRLDLVRRDLTGENDRDPATNLHGRLQTAVLGGDLDVSAFALHRRHRSSSGERPLFLGIQAITDDDVPFGYWLELAHVRGTEGSADIRGYGFDVGARYRTTWPLTPSGSAGFAFGTGDGNEEDGVDHDFRQTGLQENEAPLAGIANVRLYGELFDPELSNLATLRLAAGLQPSATTSIDLVHHQYWQHRAAPSLRSSGLGAEPSGEHRHLGSELDLVGGLESEFGVDFKAALGIFFPGRAFARSRTAVILRIEAAYLFASPW